MSVFTFTVSYISYLDIIVCALEWDLLSSFTSYHEIVKFHKHPSKDIQRAGSQSDMTFEI